MKPLEKSFKDWANKHVEEVIVDALTLDKVLACQKMLDDQPIPVRSKDPIDMQDQKGMIQASCHTGKSFPPPGKKSESTYRFYDRSRY
jgi:hypothetical protein